jgi:hypothetical protein
LPLSAHLFLVPHHPGDDDRAAKEAAERKRLANEALAAAAAAKKAQQERAAKAQQETATETPPPPPPAAAAAAPAAADETPAAADAPSTDEDAATPAEASAATAEGDDEGAPAPAPAPAAPGLVASWVSAGTAGLKVAAGVGANLAAGAAEATRTSLIKVQEATRNISFASADSVRYTKLYDTFVKQSGTIEITVNANAVTQIPFFVPKGRAIVWKVLVKALDVAFSMKLRVQEMGGAVEHELEAEQRVAAGTFFVGDRKAIDFEDRHVVVFFDNRALPRGLRAKTLAYKVTVAAPEVVAGVKDEYAKEAEEFAAQAAAAKAEAPPATTEPASEEDGAAASEGDAATTKGGVGLVGNLLNYSSTVISTAQTNATILVQKAQENPRVSGALQFLQTKGAGVGSVFGKLNVWGKKAEADDAAAATEDATPTEEAAPEAAAGTVAAAPSPKSPKGDADDSFTESDAPAAFVSVDLGGAKPN